MATTTIYADRIQIIDENHPNTSGTANALYTLSEKEALIHFTSLPAELQHRKITKIKFNLYFSPHGVGSFYSYVYLLKAGFDSTVTWNSAPGWGPEKIQLYSASTAQYRSHQLTNTSSFWDLARLFSYGVRVWVNGDSDCFVSTSLSSNAPYLEIEYTDEDYYGSVSGTPVSGNVPKKFQWSYTPPADTLSPPSATGFRLAYRKATSGDFTFVNCGTDLEYTPPLALYSNTDVIDWYPEVTVSTGQTIVPVLAGSPRIYHLEVNHGAVSGSPSSGYVPKLADKVFRWAYDPPGSSDAPVSVTGYRFAYRKGTTGNFTFVSCGTDLSYTVPAGTFSDADTVQWYPEATLDTGQILVPLHSGSPAVYTISTVEPAFTAVPVSPSGTYEDNSEPLAFTWTASNSAGTVPSGAELQYSADGGASWTTFGTVSGSALTYIAPANTLPSGQLFWRVRALNNENIAGAWSGSLDFINVSAPIPPAVSSDAAPFTTITWDAVGQQAAEVIVDGVSLGVLFGAGKTFKLSQPLTNGNHTVEVKIQGAYGLWSQPGVLVLTVENQPLGRIALEGAFGTDAVLSWTASDGGADFLIYRDGVQIGHTAETAFTDRRAVGAHEWHVLLRLADGNYTMSNVVTGEIVLDAPMIAPLAGGPWISLRLTDDGMAQQQFKYSRTHTLRHFSGSSLPVLELSPFEDVSGTLQCAFPTEAEARPFEALRGQVVILKTHETVLIGGLMNLSKARNPLYVSYQFTLNQIAVEEIVDDPDS